MTALYKLVFFTLVLCLSFPLFSQTKEKDENKPAKNVKFLPIPYLSYSRNLKFEMGAIPMVMYKINKSDTISPESISGLGGVYTTNESFFVMAFSKLYLKEDHWRITMAAGTGNLNSQAFISDISIPGLYDYATEFTLVHINVQRKITGNWYGGLAYTYSKAASAFDKLPFSSNNINNSITIGLASDQRDDVYYPKKGSVSRLKWNTFPVWFGNDLSANTVSLVFNKYKALRKGKDVIAGRAFSKIGVGSIDFEQQVVIGGNDIRGYSLGEYRGDGIMAVQGEYRWNFSPTMGMVGFAGLATLYGAGDPNFDWKLYPGVGLGYRYTAFKKNNMNIGLDAAVGKGDWGIYFRIGEAF